MDVLKTLCKIYKVFKAFHDYKCMHAVLSFACSHQAPLPARTRLLYFERVWNGWVVITYCSGFEYLLFLLTICRRTKWWRGWSTPCWSMATSTLATAVVWWSHLSLTDAIGLYRFTSVKNAFASFFFQFFIGFCYAVILFWWEQHLYTVLSFVIFVFYCRKPFFLLKLLFSPYIYIYMQHTVLHY